MTYAYKPQVLEELARHGLVPHEHTPPQVLRDALRDLYKYEIKVLKGRLLGGAFPRQQYASRVVELRLRYPLLSIPVVHWMAQSDAPTGTE